MPTPPERPPKGETRRIPGAEVVAGEILIRDADLGSVLDEQTRAVVEERLAGILPGHVVDPGRPVPQRTVPTDDLQRMVAAAAVVAAGLDPSRTRNPPPPVLWEDGAGALLVRIAEVRATTADGVVEITVPVRCDETGDADVTVTFVTGSPHRPAGAVAVTEDRPRGPAVVVEHWHEALIAFAWHTLLQVTAALAQSAGNDPAGRPLAIAAIAATPHGLTVRPMARHVYDRLGIMK